MKPDSGPGPDECEAEASVPHERHGLGNRNVGARLPELLDGAPRDPDFLAAWSLIRRRALAGAVRRGGAPYFRVFETPIEGTPIHVHGPDRDPHDEDHFTRGLQAYGALGYGLLRGQLVVLPEQRRRSRDLDERYNALIEEMAAAYAVGVADHTLAYVEGSRLIFWDALGFLLSMSEQLAALVLSVNEWEGTQRDFGEAIVRLRRKSQPHRVFGQAFFRGDSWWRRQLQLHENYERMPNLSSRQRELLGALSAESMNWVRAATANLHNTWNRELHRVATRYKHSFTLLSASLGVAWPSGEQTTDADLIGELHSTGGLIVADQREDGTPVQLAVEVTIGGIEVLLTAVAEAVALTEALVSALLKRVEHVTGRVLPIHWFTINSGTEEELVELAVIFSGMSEHAWRQSVDEEIAKRRRHEEIRDAAIRQRAREGGIPPHVTEGDGTSNSSET